MYLRFIHLFIVSKYTILILKFFYPWADRARVLIPPGYLHPGKQKHSRNLKFVNDHERGSPTMFRWVVISMVVILTDLKNMADCHE